MGRKLKDAENSIDRKILENRHNYEQIRSEYDFLQDLNELMAACACLSQSPEPGAGPGAGAGVGPGVGVGAAKPSPVPPAASPPSGAQRMEDIESAKEDQKEKGLEGKEEQKQ